MIDIITEKGEKYSYDEDTERVFKDGYLIPSSEIEPIYSEEIDKNSKPPVFSGLWLKKYGMILSLTGKYSSISDINSIY